MAMLVVVLLFGTTVMVGATLAWHWWMGTKAPRWMSAVHLLIAAAGLEGLALLLRGAPDGTTAPAGWLGGASALGLAAAFITGLLVPLIAKPKPAATTPAIVAHASIATASFCAMIYWLMNA